MSTSSTAEQQNNRSPNSPLRSTATAPPGVHASHYTSTYTGEESSVQLIHGTSAAAWQKIQAEGLHKGPHGIALAPVDERTEAGVIPGIAEPDILIYINMEQAAADGLEFKQEEGQAKTIVLNGETLDKKYISQVVDRRNGVLLIKEDRRCMMSMEQFRSMKLYSDSKIKHILHKAADIAWIKGKELKPTDFAALDMLHYLGTEGIDSWFDYYKDTLIRDSEDTEILDIGSGAGGPARYMSWNFPVHVKGVEYMDDFVRVAWVINALLKIPEEKCQIMNADITKMHLPTYNFVEAFDGVVSQLVFLHIPDKARLFKQMSRAMKPGSVFVIEDFFQKGEFTPEEETLLEQRVSVPHATLPTEAEYRKYLETHHFVIDKWDDMTGKWSNFVWDRCESFHSESDSLEQEFGPLYVAELGEFYDAITRLFHSNIDGKTHPNVSKAIGWDDAWLKRPQNLGGVRIFGHRDEASLSRSSSTDYQLSQATSV
eukprot:TRINITY_DN84421_c0_g1_i1.p1 TRINITY_DN84421_c0_g1~~TRINITY_DN84421_c0_g1_i1.p1  ORF type:complete len:503 (-),score=27.92 TRINITY_DN84421_c0_g1_i1:117-1571(-)